MPPKVKDPDLIRKENAKSFNSFLTRNAKLIAPDTNLGVVYAGFKGAGAHTPQGIFYDIKQSPVRPLADVVNDLKPMWKFIKEWNQMVVKATGKVRYHTVEDVLKGIKDYPRMVQPEGKFAGAALMYKSLYDCANELGDKKKALLPPAEISAVWKKLSKIYVSNIKGEMAVLKGVLETLKPVDETKILINTEVPALLKNKDLAADARKEVAKIAKASQELTAAKRKLEQELSQLYTGLKKGA